MYIRNMNNSQVNNYATYKTVLRNNTRKNNTKNSSNALLASPENSIFRRSNLIHIINSAIMFSNKALRRFKNGDSNSVYTAYQYIEPISVLNIYTHKSTGKHYKIYGYPGFEVAEKFKCRGVRTIKGSSNIIDNNVKTCIEEADLDRIIFKPAYIDEPANKHVVLVVLDNVRIIAVIDNNITFMNSLTLKEQEFVKSITAQDMLELMSQENKTFAGSDFKNDANMSSVMPEMVYPSREHRPKLTFSESVNVKEIPKIGKRRVRGGDKRKTRKNRLRAFGRMA